MEDKINFPAEAPATLIRRELHTAPPFKHWPDNFIEELASMCRIATYSPDTLILRRGEVAPALYIVVSGSVEISAANIDGGRLVIRYAGPHWAFGLLSLLDDHAMNHYCRAHERTSVVVISKNSLFDILRRAPALWESVVREVTERNRFILLQFAEHAFVPLRVRLVRAILILAESYGIGHEEGVAVELRLAKEKLGALLGVSRQSVTKEIKPLENEGLLSMHYGRILILDIAALRAIGRPD